ncbi:MAG: DUF1810 domain-containing protein [Alphaproteobacteria bacterium]|nr:DUF1810 domain-containing protein [Alphaproteobacteria bacterium]
MDNYNLNRFIEAQQNMYKTALNEIKDGYKQSHWIWYIFPQHEDLGYSYNSKFYGIHCLEEAKEYLFHPVLGARLKEILTTLLEHSDKSIEDILGGIDALKLKSSMTLFDIVSPNDIFNTVLNVFYNGEQDNLTLSLLSR